MRETPARSWNGTLMLLLLLAALVASVALLIGSAVAKFPGGIVAGALAVVVEIFLLAGLFMVEPNQGRVLTLFGAYKGTERTPGLRWANPFLGKRAVSLRVRNFETDRLKVNDADGNPIEIAAVVVWKVVDTFEAVFRVDDYENYVHVQSEAALRGMATRYPYDSHESEHDQSLRGSTPEIAEELRRQLDERLDQAGVDVLESRISHLAYAPEIAQAMLQRQQASAIIAARQKIVDGAVGMVEMALTKLAEMEVVELDQERRAAMVSNLLVVLCSDRATTPVVNTGSLY
ncbi:MAG: SPFH domain-containing protein [Acidobacteria bacterium]|nr:SPFH domain-containing protein [Acidobacteriota bacterium]MCB9377421.1 SPFH domain-containing protein [Holophagales bacterium]